MNITAVEKPGTGTQQPPLPLLLGLPPDVWDPQWARDLRYRLENRVLPRAEHPHEVLDLLALHPEFEGAIAIDVDYVAKLSELQDFGVSIDQLRQNGVECPIIAITHSNEPGLKDFLLECGYNAVCPLLHLADTAGVLLHIPSRGGFPHWNI